MIMKQEYLGELGPCHSCWCLGSFHGQDISKQAWCWLFRIYGSLSSRRKNFKYLHLSVQKYIFMSNRNIFLCCRRYIWNYWDYSNKFHNFFWILIHDYVLQQRSQTAENDGDEEDILESAGEEEEEDQVSHEDIWWSLRESYWQSSC